LQKDLETKAILKKVAVAERELGRLKGVTSKIPNEAILINTLFLQEAKASSEIENIVTTHDEIFKNQLNLTQNIMAKEVENYSSALRHGYDIVRNKSLLTTNHICKIQEILENNKAGLRTQSGTTLKDNHGNIVYEPPQDAYEVKSLMSNLEKFINDNSISDISPLIKMAIIHHQFESIHPFYDGNGRTGRIINVLYLVLQELLDVPVLYLSGYIIEHKQVYYKLLQKVREEECWEEWVTFILDAVISTAKQTIAIIEEILALMQTYKVKIREHYAFYSQDLINTLFKHPYTKIDFLATDLNCTRQTAAKYLNTLTEGEFLEKVNQGKQNYYLNSDLIELLRKGRIYSR